MQTFINTLRPILLFGLLLVSLTGCLNKTAPTSSFTTLTGQTLEPQTYLKQVTLVHFWATDCTTCIREMPEIVSTWKQFNPQGFQVIAIAMQHDRPDYVVNYAQTRQIPFPIVLDLRGEHAKAWDNVQVTPTSYLLNKKGQIIKKYIGEPDFAALRTLIEKELKS